MYGLFYWKYKYETIVPFELISSGCNALVVQFQQLLEGHIEVLLCDRVNDLRHSLFRPFNCIITTASELREKPKVTGSNVWTICKVCNCLNVHLGCGLVHCPDGKTTDPIWRVLASYLGISSRTPLKPQHSNTNPNPLANNLWCIDFLTPPHLSSSLADSLPSLNLLCHSKTDVRFKQDAPKAVWSIPYVSAAFYFSSLKYNFIEYRSSKVSWRPDCIFEIHQLWQSGFSRVYSSCCCSCSFEAEIIEICPSSYKMYSNNILNFQVYTIILNACTKKSGNLWYSPRIYDVISTLNRNAPKLVDHFTYPGNIISSTDIVVNIAIGKAWTDIGKLSII